MRKRVFRFFFLLTVPLLLATAPAQAADSVTLHVIRSPYLDWRSPRGLARTTVDNSTGLFGHPPYPIGHVMVEIDCGGTKTFSGMIQRFSDEARNLILNRGYALGILFHSFTGRMQSSSSAQSITRSWSQNSRYASIKFAVSSPACARAQEFYTTLVNENLTPWYGFPSRTEYGEGGGCSWYGVSFLRAAGVNEDWTIQEWGRFVRVPTSAVGGPLTGRSISLNSMLNGPTRWATEAEPHFPLFLYDPDLMYAWAKRIHAAPETPGPWGPVLTRRVGNGLYLELDKSGYLLPSTPLFEAKNSDPREVLTRPELLSTRWEREVRIWQEAQP